MARTFHHELGSVINLGGPSNNPSEGGSGTSEVESEQDQRAQANLYDCTSRLTLADLWGSPLANQMHQK